jgi:glycerophosphoryl diester phosphodiesterase
MVTSKPGWRGAFRKHLEIMNILCHRGLWESRNEQNSVASLGAAAVQGFGVETDIRDRLGALVISHDPASIEAPLASELFNLFHNRPDQLLALNIKADGLAQFLFEHHANAQGVNWAAFDMSVPDMRSFERLGLPFLTRQSELEAAPVLYDKATGVWLDAFFSEWYGEELLERHISAGKIICLVSPELHGRDHRGFWERLARWKVSHSPHLFLCTDFPIQAREVFNA